jgi:phosphoserine phosphatase
MSHVATLIADPQARTLDAAIVRRVADALPSAGLVDWLDPGIAADIPFEPPGPIDAPALGAILAGDCADTEIDVVVQPAANRRKRLFLADMDSTIIGQECIDELADFAGLKAHVSAITERAMRGEIDFEPALRERVALLAGLPESVIDAVIAERITLNPGARTLVATMRANGAYAALVSGGFTAFTTRIAKQAGFDENRANVLHVADGKLTGTVAEPILGRDAKLATLRELRAGLKLAAFQTLAVGDGANDLAMLGEAGLGVAYHAKPAVAAAAHARIEHSDLTALLYIQGYRRSAFVESEG